MKYGIAIFPAKKLQDLANSYRKRFDSHYALIPPHVTLKDAFETDEDPKNITDTLEKIALQHEPFPIRVSKVSSFQPVSNTIYFKVERTDELEALNNELTDKLPGEKPEHQFVPHITIGQKLSDDQYADLLGQLELLGVNHEETVDRFHLLYQLDNGSWTVYETFRLGKNPQ